jgi:predicted dehydrogenase
MITFGVIGYGYWGPNIVRNIMGIDGVTVGTIADKNPNALKRASKSCPGVELTDDYSAITGSPDIDAVAIVTPVSTHFELAKKALENGKHVFVEKPFTATAAQAEQLIELAEKNKLRIMVDHTFIFTGAVRKIKEIIDTGDLGDIYYFDSMRVNLGLFQHDVNVIWDLAPHDLAIMDYLISEKPVAVSATGAAHLNHGMENIAFVTVYFPNNIIAHINVNWLSPVKVRTTLLCGQKKMLVWNDLEPADKIKIYDKGVDITSAEGVYNLLVSYRSGDMWAPKVDQTEALKLEVQHFIDCINNGGKNVNDGYAGLSVIKMLEAANRSLQSRGGVVEL